MATSSFSKEFIINDPKSVELLIEAMENPTTVKLSPRKSEEQEQKEEEELLCLIKKRLASLN